MRFGQAHFPRQTGILDRRRRRGTRATIVARDQDHVGFRLRNTSGNRSDSRGRDEFHCYLTAWVDLLQVVDQLREVFDRIDVVVGWGRDQRHTRCRMPQTRDQLSHLHARQLTAFTWFRTLCDLDLQFFALVQILCGHTKTTGCHLLDLCRRIVAVRLGHKVCRIFAAFAGIRFRTDPVHCNVQRLVRLWAECA